MTNSQINELYELSIKYRMTAEEVESLGTWAGKITLLAIEPLKTQNELLKTLLENQANAVKTYTNLYHEAQAKLAMLTEAIVGDAVQWAYDAGAGASEYELFLEPECKSALSATAEDVERWKAEQRLKWTTEECQRVLLQEERLKESLPIATGSVLELAAAGYRYYEALQQDRFTLIDEVDEAEKSFLKSADSLSPEVKAMLNSINPKQGSPNA